MGERSLTPIGRKQNESAVDFARRILSFPVSFDGPPPHQVIAAKRALRKAGLTA